MERGGQSGMEFLCVFLGLILLLKGVMIVFHLTAGSLWMDHQLYQNLICLAEGRPPALCQKALMRNIKTISPAGAISHLRTGSELNRWKGEIKWTLYGISLQRRQKLVLP